MNITKHKNKAFFAPQPLSFVKTVKEALIPRSVLYKLQKITKLYNSLQSVTKHLGRPSRKLWQYAGAKGRQKAFRRRLSTHFSLNALVINEPYISHEFAEHWKSLLK